MRTLAIAASVLAGGHASPTPAAVVPTAPCPAAVTPPAPPAAASIDGYWTGVLGGALHLALSVKGSSGVLDSIDQDAKLPIDRLAVTGTAVHFEIARVNGSYDGTVS